MSPPAHANGGNSNNHTHTPGENGTASIVSEVTPLIANNLAHGSSANHDEPEPWGHHDRRSYVRYSGLVSYTAWQVLASNYVNVLLVFVPLGIIAGALGWSPSAVFCLNFVAIIPLAALLSFATEELSAKLGQTIGGLMNATFGNAVELIVSIVALKNGEIRIVQSSMLGSILSNSLLVLGCCFLAGGLSRSEQAFNETVASTMSSLMAVACASLIIPATLYSVLPTSDKESEQHILVLSHGTAIILLLLYILYLWFQLKSHANLFTEVEAPPEGEDAEQEEAPEGKTLGPVAAGFTLVIITVAVAVCAEFLVDSIDSIVQTAHISKTFIGLILLPIVGNAAEHVTAVVVAYKSKMDLAINVAIGSSMQIALFVTPFLVLLGWIMGIPMTLHFQTFETVVFFVSVLVMNYLIQDGKSNYLEGAMCIGTYIIIAIAFYVYPDNAGDITGLVKNTFA
ncbi:manganese resistance 1 protein [Phyllosticta citribraziliensis]|uniref:Vacuolar calcium ion transporter n=1 Tax=Phyllosticta citribraziliensis TaxID=989973 RepID=A0ABR1M8N5_9PEZI